MAAIQDLIPYIYHEKQQEGEMLCAQHALNSLLQGQYFSAPDLAEIARELDKDEQRELDEGERAQTSNNMDDTGFFSVQVLQKALLDNFNLALVPWGAEDLRPYHDHPHTQMAFILNHAQHWYTLRRFGSVSADPALDADPGGGHWFNLNSFVRAPERISKLYLGMFLQQAAQQGYSIFAVIQRDLGAELALPRVNVDELFSSIPEEGGNTNFQRNTSNTTSGSTQSNFSNTAHGIDGLEDMEDADMELQAALQASLSGGDYGAYIPQRFSVPASAPAPAPAPSSFPQPPSRTASGVPIRRDYQVIEPEDDDDDDDDAEMYAEPLPMPGSLPAPSASVSADPVAASMARQRAVMERMRAAQELALQEQYEDEVARFDATARARARRRTEAEDEDEMLRRAIAESEAMAKAHGERGVVEEPDEDEDEDEDAPRQPARAPTWQQHRVYDDEDEELQAALRASLETVPEGFRMPSPPPIPAPVRRASQQSTPQALTPPVPAHPPSQPPPLERQASEDFETESEGTAEPEPEQLSMEEIRRRRLARFGG